MRYIWDSEAQDFVDPGQYYASKAAERDRSRSSLAVPYIQGDIEYISPLTGKPVTSRSERREELKRNNCREADPSEFTPKYQDPKYERRYSKRAREIAQSR